MKLEKRKPSGREKDEESTKLLSQLREKLHTNNISTARRSAYNLSWMQEDGLDILKEALFGDFSKTTKCAAAYGLRNMQGRMKESALGILKKGTTYNNRNTKDVCKKAFLVLERKVSGKTAPRHKARKSRIEIREIPRNNRRRRVHHDARRPF